MTKDTLFTNNYIKRMKTIKQNRAVFFNINFNLNKCMFFVLVFILFMSFILPVSYSVDDWFYNAKYLTIKSQIGSTINVIGNLPEVDYIMANLSFFPKDGAYQEILSRKITPQEQSIGENIVFNWDNPKSNELNFSVQTVVRTTNYIVKIPEKVSFPLRNVPDSLKAYLLESKNIDITPEISNLANSIVDGRDDLYDVVFELSKWTKNNIDYDLSSLTSDVSQPASWVLKTRIGVCDELTNLFIALCRSVGIPARFVSGFAYTDSPEFSSEWGSHGWAEVYFPGYGWVPFDPTYGEFGYVDPTHVVLKESFDSEDSATYYEWKGNNFDVVTKGLDIDTSIISKEGEMKPFISLESDLLYEQTDFGSYNIVHARVSNLNNYYVAVELNILKSSEVSVVGERFKQLLLFPNEKRDVYWIIGLSDSLSKDYVYTFPIEVYSTRNVTSKTQFEASFDGPFYDYSTVKNYYDSKSEEFFKKYSSNVELTCDFENEQYHLGERAKVLCVLSNLGDKDIKNLELCVDDVCDFLDVGIGQSKEISKFVLLDSVGERTFFANLYGEEVSKSSRFETLVLDKPYVSVQLLDYPKNVTYDDEFFVKFKLLKESVSIPSNLKVTIYKNGMDNSWDLLKLENDRIFEIGLKGKDLLSGENDFFINVTYYDDFGREYSSSDTEFKVYLSDLTFSQKIRLFFNRVNVFFQKLF